MTFVAEVIVIVDRSGLTLNLIVCRSFPLSCLVSVSQEAASRWLLTSSLRLPQRLFSCILFPDETGLDDGKRDSFLNLFCTGPGSFLTASSSLPPCSAAFIIHGEYVRTDESKDPVERVRDTLEEVGLSISLTTLTTALAFGLGMLSSIPQLIWCAMYAFPTVIIDFIYQIT